MLCWSLPASSLAPPIAVGKDWIVSPSLEGPPLSEMELAVLDDGSVVEAWIADRNTTGTGTPEPRLWLSITDATGFEGDARRVEQGRDTVRAFSRLALATDGARIAVVWEGERDGADGTQPMGIYFASFDRQLNRLSGPRLVSGSGPRERRLPRLAATRNELIVAFTAFAPLPSYSDVYARRLSWNGSPRGGAFQVNEDSREAQFLEDVVLFEGGEAVFSWFDERGGESTLGDIFGRRFDAANQPLGSSFRLSQEEVLGTRQEGSSMAALVGDRVVVAWESAGDSDPGSLAVYARLLELDGSMGEPFIVHADHALDQADPDVAALPDGGFLVVWHDACLQAPACFASPGPRPSRDGSGSGVYGRVFDALGIPKADDFHLAQLVAGDQSAPRAASALGGPDSALAELGNEPSTGAGVIAGWRTRPTTPGAAPVFTYRRVEAPCAAGLGVACIGEGDRFRLWMNRRTDDGVLDLARAREEAPSSQLDWGAFSFFERSNLDAVVRVLDARHLTGTFWIYFASLSNLEFELWVLDTLTGLRRHYVNPAGSFASFGDTVGLIDYSALPWEPPLNEKSAPEDSALRGRAGNCEPSTFRLCVDERFAVEVTWTDFSEQSGSGHAIDLENDTGAFWFFDPTTPDLVIKVLDGRAINGHWWVFGGSASNVAFEIEVTDLLTGNMRTYVNPLGTFASFGDVEALPAGGN